MQPDFSASQPDQSKINWAKEAAVGALISAIFTIMAIHAGTDGVAGASISGYLHDAMIIGGLTMLMVCSYATVVLVVGQTLDSAKQSMALRGHDGAKSAGFFGTMQTAKFLKIFLP